jgi:hypothetical protein
MLKTHVHGSKIWNNLATNVTNKKEEQTDPMTETFAILAGNAYKEGAKERQSDVRENFAEHQTAGWEYDLRLSDDLTAVWVNKGTKEVIMSNRGTVTSDAGDLWADAAIITGTEHMSSRFKKADKKFKQIKSKYNPDNWSLSLTGHSLGGAVNNSLFEKHHDDIHEIHNYNPGSGLNDALGKKVVKDDKDYGKVHEHHIKGDVLSMFTAGNPNKHVHVYDQTAESKHTIGNFIPGAVKEDTTGKEEFEAAKVVAGKKSQKRVIKERMKNITSKKAKTE